ncbi:ABC transporter permease [Paenibacillus macerans]|uniref:ABC transporter permease n=1 Tax=Paenibacillus macerans TaxID=44252 RepID=UPI00203FBA63|nr:ABC transporter permease [Paenibacillus macerans]MCM3702046.1 ABC transporter permease [Paenibacillus macerans]
MMRSITINKPGKRSLGVKCLAVLVLIGVWQWISLSLPDILFASPLDTLRALARMARSGELARQLLTSGGRMLAGFFCGTAAGIAAGLLAGIFSIFYEAMRPVLSLLMGIPPIILVVLAMVWFGTGATVPVFVVSLLVFPSIYLNTADGWRGIDRQLLQMAEVYRIGPMKKLRYIVIPGLAVPIFTAVSLAAGSAVRTTIMAELLGSDNGIGYSLAFARVNLDTAKVFAWTFVSIVAIQGMDLFVIKPLRKFALRWNHEEIQT